MNYEEECQEFTKVLREEVGVDDGIIFCEFYDYAIERFLRLIIPKPIVRKYEVTITMFEDYTETPSIEWVDVTVPKPLFIVGKYLSGETKGVVWSYVGTYTDQQKAEDACQTEDYFVGPTKDGINPGYVRNIDEIWEGLYYPEITGSRVPKWK